MEMLNGHVMTCHADDCSYNCDARCCAPSIEIGDDHPMCDMYTTKPVQDAMSEPMVSKCMVGECHFNSQMACSAAGITLMRHSDHADCATYRA